VQDLQSENDQLNARADKAEAETASLKADSKVKDAAIAQLQAFRCGQFPNAPMCQP